MPVMGAVMVRDFEITLISIDFNTVKLISEHTAASIIMSEIKLTMEGRNQMEHHCINLTIGCDERK